MHLSLECAQSLIMFVEFLVAQCSKRNMGERTTLHKTWKTFCESGTIHGLNQIRQTSYPWKVLWQLFFIAKICPIVRLCNNSFSRYLRYDMKTTMTYDTVKEIPYPSITFCNQFGLKTNATLDARLLYTMETTHTGRAADVVRMFEEV